MEWLHNDWSELYWLHLDCRYRFLFHPRNRIVRFSWRCILWVRGVYPTRIFGLYFVVIYLLREFEDWLILMLLKITCCTKWDKFVMAVLTWTYWVYKRRFLQTIVLWRIASWSSIKETRTFYHRVSLSLTHCCFDYRWSSLKAHCVIPSEL